MLKLKEYPKELNLKLYSNLLNVNFLIGNLYDAQSICIDNIFNVALSKKTNKKVSIEKSQEYYQIILYRGSTGTYLNNKYTTLFEIISLKEAFNEKFAFFISFYNIENKETTYQKYYISVNENDDFIITKDDTLVLKNEKNSLNIYKNSKLIDETEFINEFIDLKKIFSYYDRNNTMEKYKNNLCNLLLSILSNKKDFEKYKKYIFSYFNHCDFDWLIYLSKDSFYDLFCYSIDNKIIDISNKTTYQNIDKYNPIFTKKDFPNAISINKLSDTSLAIYKNQIRNSRENVDEYFDLFVDMEKNKYIGSDGIILIRDFLQKYSSFKSQIHDYHEFPINDDYSIDYYREFNAVTKKMNKPLKEILEIVVCNIFEKNIFCTDTLKLLK